MKAFVLPYAGAELPQLAEVAPPATSADELLVRVKAVGVGIHDSYFLPGDATYPYPIGIEAAGVVETAGLAVTAHHPGDRVAFVSSMQPKGGTWAEFVAVRADSLIVSVPETMSFVEAAALPVAGNTVLRALRALGPAAGSLFIAGGSGAIGTLAIQLAVRRGWRVAASASEGNRDYLRSLGAELAVDYRDPCWAAQVLRWMPGGVDAAIAVQPDTSTGSLGVVRDGGGLISISGDRLEPERGIVVQVVPHSADVGDELSRLMLDVAAGEVRVEIEQVLAFEDAGEALAKVATRHARGKIVLQLDA
ncbi:quinone oxidoreductase [Humibacillus sp. DSM 29435]|uniref:NADP-dependent oxidoreductase n=1 Tax=Humibacillus sp. DSM 29435 TaxID=1869167 RepID=UPI000872A855|nr:NADP-dependent oxidoreductase [Humibacillus sp. DSM 29435]OFE15436.1 quinone oxidoreductase [Humibacillus sp. DSM 29435]